jgi:hypothetical protein
VGNEFALSERSGIFTVFAASILSVPARHAACETDCSSPDAGGDDCKSSSRIDAVSRYAPVSIGFQMHFIVFD